MGRRYLAALTLGWALVAADSGLVSTTLKKIADEWGLTGTETGILLNSFMIGMFAGALLFGRAADSLGRRTASVASLVLTAAATAACAASAGWVDMAAIRFAAGLGAAGYLVSASTYLSEVAPRSVRGRYVALMESGWAFGWLLSAGIGLALADEGWRSVFAWGGPLPLLAAVLIPAAGLGESPRYLAAAGRRDEAERLAEELGIELTPPPPRRPVSEILRGPYLRRTAMLWIHWFAIVMTYWGVFLWFPKILADRGLSLVGSLRYNLMVTAAQIPGYWSAAYLVERVGRRTSLSAYMALAGLGTAVYWWASDPTQALAGALTLSFFNLGAWGVTYAYTPELYPTDLRATGAGAANSFGRLGGILGPYLVGAVLDLTGSYQLALLTFAAAQLTAAAAVAVLGVETRGRELE